MSTILIVDDEESILTVSRAILERRGYRTVAARDAESAEKALEEGNIDLILLDVVLPGRGGLDLLMSIRQRNPDLPVVIMSGKISPGSDAFHKLASQFGAKCILAKPFSGEDLIQSVEAVLAASCS